MDTYVKNIFIICITLTLFFLLTYFVGSSIGVAHVILTAAASYAIVLNVRAIKRN